MNAFDTNVAVHAANTSSPSHPQAREFLQQWGGRRDVVVCELMLVESAPVMAGGWPRVKGSNFAFRHIIDLRLALTLRHHGVTRFATTNTKNFQDAGFDEVWNPLRTD